MHGWLAPIAAIGGGAGTFLGGYLCDRLAHRDVRWYVWLPAGAIVASVPFGLFIYLSPGHVSALLAAFVPAVLGLMYIGPIISVTHAMVTVRMRAVASSILFLVLNLVGMGAGPFFTGLLSDVLGARLGDPATGLRYALCSVVLVNLWCAAHYFYAGRWLRDDLDRVGQH